MCSGLLSQPVADDAAERGGGGRIDLDVPVDVTISVQRRRGRTYQTLFRKRPFLRKFRRGRQHWLVARDTTHWSFGPPKRLPRGKYLVRTRAIDFAGNVQKPRVRRLRLR